MNAQAGLPEALASRQRRVTVSDDLQLGGTRGAHISIRSSRFRLINANGEETLVPNLHLDTVIIRANPKTSKLFYDTWDPNNPQPPVCFSDNGVAPSTNALRPQSPTCMACPHNQMNSKINPQTGKGSKACKDLKKLAVIIPDDPAVNVYELQVPPDSLSNLRSYSAFLSQQATGGQRKVDIGDMITRLSFDAEASHPKLKFEPVGWADDTHTLQMIDYIYDQQLDIAAVGMNDVAADPETVRQSIALRAQYQQPQQGNGQAPQFQLPPRQEQHTFQPGLQEAPKPRGRPRKVQEQVAATSPAPPTPQFAGPIPATPVASPGMPEIPEFLRRPAVNHSPPVPPQPQASPQSPMTPQFGMAAAPPPPPAVSEALQAAMRMPPRR